MSIQFRLIAAIGSLLALALVWIVATMLFEAGPRIRAESVSILRLSKGLVQTSIRALGDARDPEAALATLVQDLGDVRHLRIALEGEGQTRPPQLVHEPKRSWLKGRLAKLIALEPSIERVPVDVGGRRLGTLVLISKPGDEINEVLEEIGDVAWRGLLLALGLFALTSLVVNRALAPVDRLRRAMGAMQAGNYDIVLPETGAPEIAAISRKLNALAATLSAARSENRWLSEKVIRVADDERRDLARELHDELGPYLFAVRAGTTSLKREVESERPDMGRLSRACATLLDQIDAIQRTNRRVLVKLRPVGLNELGLARSLEGLISLCQADRQDVEVTLDVATETAAIDETSALTVYRVVQEGLTNAFRHAGATRIDVAITMSQQAGGGEGAPRPALKIRVTDNGKGLAEEKGRGFGLTGMSERVWALGGTLTVSNLTEGGVALEAVVPVARK